MSINKKIELIVTKYQVQTVKTIKRLKEISWADFIIMLHFVLFFGKYIFIVQV